MNQQTGDREWQADLLGKVWEFKSGNAMFVGHRGLWETEA